MHSLRYMNMADTITKSLAATYPELGDPERRWELAEAIANIYEPKRGDAENRTELRKAAEEHMKASGAADAQSGAAAERGADIYAFNFIWMRNGAVFATETHYVSYPNQRYEDYIEHELAESGIGKQGVMYEEGVRWQLIANNVAFDTLDNDISIKFYGKGSGRPGEVTVGELRERLQGSGRAA
jgi:hypothetical protein